MATQKKVFNSISYELPVRYDPIKVLGSGTFGSVISAFDKEKNEKVAIKKLLDIEDFVDAKRALREIIVMKYLKHENLLNLKDLIYLPSPKNLPIGEIYLVNSLMETDLHRIIKAKVQLSDDHVQFIMYQLLKALHFIHSAGVIHRDIKPGNILLNENCDIKICDFGLSRGLGDKTNELTEYVVTRFYRAPEIMLSSQHYGKEVDLWSVGCSMAEILSRHVLFPGDNYIEQINMIIDICGKPDDETIKLFTNEHAAKYIASLPFKPKVPLAKIINYHNPLAIDLLEKMLVFNPSKRLTVDEALKHPYISGYYDAEEITSMDKKLDFSFENDESLTIENLAKMIKKEAKDFDSSKKISID